MIFDNIKEKTPVADSRQLWLVHQGSLKAVFFVRFYRSLNGVKIEPTRLI